MSKQTLVFIPGLMCDEAVWTPQIAALEDRAQLQVADHGLTDSLVAMAEAIIARAPPKFAVAGHSMGGRVALEVVRRAGARVTGLALLDTGATPRAPGEAGEREQSGRYELLELARREGMRAVGERWLRIPMVYAPRLTDAPLIEAIVDMFERQSADRFEAQIRALLNRPDARPLLPLVSCPTLVLCGADDAWAPLAQHRVLSQMIPHSKLVAVPECGHMSTMERPQAVNAALSDWLDQIERRAA